MAILRRRESANAWASLSDGAGQTLSDGSRIAVIGGGPAAHSGLTGRKTGMDTYGEYARHSGTALSGKDPMRIDRVGAYMPNTIETVVAMLATTG